jgi:hypothetical protein
MKPLDRYLTPGKFICTLNHSWCANPISISVYEANAEKPATFAFSNVHPFGCRLLLRCCIAFSNA